MDEMSIFWDAAGMRGAARADFLEGACGGDAALRGRVERLLAAHEEEGSFLDGPATGVGEVGARSTRLATIAERYRSALEAFIASLGIGADGAARIVSGYLDHLEKHRENGAEPQPKEPLRRWFAGDLSGFLRWWPAAAALESGAGEPWFSGSGCPDDGATAGRALDREWALTVFRRTLGRLEESYAERGKEEVFAAIKPFLSGGPDPGILAEVSCRLGFSEDDLRHRIVRLRARYRACLEGEVAETLAGPHGVGEEITRLARLARASE